MKLKMNTNWKSKYYTKTIEESSLLIFQDLQIQSYIKQFLISHGLVFHDYKINCFNNRFNIYISYYTSLQSFFLINKNSNQKLKKFKFNNNQKINRFKSLKNLKQKQFLKISKNQKRNTLLKKHKNSLTQKKYINNNNLQKNNLIQKFIESLNKFLKSKNDIYLTLQNLNSELIFYLNKIEQEKWKRKLLMLKRYSKNKFFNETINIILIVVKCKNSAYFFASFIAKQFTFLKRQLFFLIFIKRTLILFLKVPQSKIIGLKMVIKGKFNNAFRAKKFYFLIGNVSIQTVNANVKYSESTAFTLNGTFGIKVWINEKNKKH